MPAGFSDQSDSEDDYFVDSKRQTVENRSSDDTLIKNVSDSDASTEETNLLMAKSDLIQAIEAGDVEEVTCLISTIGDVNPFLEVWGWGLLTPAGFSCCHSQHQVLKSLLELEDAHCNGEGFMLLAASASSNQQNDVKCAELLKNTNNENLNNIHQQGMTPLMLAAKNGKKLLVKWMIEHDADINTKDNLGWNALMFSVDNDHGDIARILLDHGADAGHINNDGQTAADIAAAGDNIVLQEIIETFIDEKQRGITRHRTKTEIRRDSELDSVLSSAGLDHLKNLFYQQNIDLETFLILKEEEVFKLGEENLADVKKLMVCQAELHTAEWRRSSLTSVKPEHRREGLMIDTPSATAMVANISQHCRYMKLNIGYIRSQLQDHGKRFLQAGADLVPPHKLLHQVGGCISHADKMTKELTLLKSELEKLNVKKCEKSINSSMKAKSGNYFMKFSVAVGSVLFIYQVLKCVK